MQKTGILTKIKTAIKNGGLDSAWIFINFPQNYSMLRVF